jgi:hypothetical protein
MLESTDDVRSGMGSSALGDAFRRGRKGANGAGCWTRAEVRLGISAHEISRWLRSIATP